MSGGTHASSAVDDLKRLIVALQASGYQGRLFTPVGKVAYVRVRNPDAAALTEIVYAQDGSFWWPWAEPIAPIAEIQAAAKQITRVLRANGGEQ